MDTVTAYFDGASRGNPGPAAVGWVITADGAVLSEGQDRIGTATNNVAEYRALAAAIDAALAYGPTHLELRGDSQLIVRQMTGEYRTRDPTLAELRAEVLGALEAVDGWAIRHVDRAGNARADALAAAALDG
jgi:ribonuclease HI